MELESPGEYEQHERTSASQSQDALQRIVGRLLSQNSNNNNSNNNSTEAATSGRPIAVVVRSNPPPTIGSLGLGAPGDLISALLSRGLPLGFLPSLMDPSMQLNGNFGQDGRSFEDLLHHLMMNESSHAHHPASPEAIAGLKRIKVESKKDNNDLGECGITLEEFRPGDVAVVLSCSHAYKEESIVEWLARHDTCPVCRTKVGGD